MEEGSPTCGVQLGPPAGSEHTMERPESTSTIFDQADGVDSIGVMSFITAHMTGILQPFAQNVEEMHKMVFSMAENMRDLRARIDDHSSTGSEHAALLFSTRNNLEQMMEQAATTQTVLEKTIAEKVESECIMNCIQRLANQNFETLTAHKSLSQSSFEKLHNDLQQTRGDLVKLQRVVETDVRSSIASNSESVRRMCAALTALESRHEKLTQRHDGHKLDYDHHVAKHGALHQEYKEHCARFREFGEANRKRFHELDMAIVASRTQAFQHTDKVSAKQAEALALSDTRLNEHAEMLAKATDELRKVDSTFSAHQEQASQNKQMIDSTDERHAGAIQKLRHDVEAVLAKTSTHSVTLSNFQDMLYGSPPNSDGKSYVQLLQEDVSLSMRRSNRFDQILGLTPLTQDSEEEESAGITLKGGVMLTNTQIEKLRSAFMQLDEDHSGKLSGAEIRHVFAFMGHEVSDEVFEIMLHDIGLDHCGEISFDEFCSLASRMMGPDGELDIETYLSQVSESAERELKVNQAVTAIPNIRGELEGHATLIMQHQLKLNSACERVQQLEVDNASLLRETQKLRKGLNANNEYWKGLSLGLQETKKTVHREGEGEMLPSAMKLRNLPPLDSRPNTAPSAPKQGL